jgi:hypothetical protein
LHDYSPTQPIQRKIAAMLSSKPYNIVESRGDAAIGLYVDPALLAFSGVEAQPPTVEGLRIMASSHSRTSA